jgi:ATP-dependent HslUV protease, peptidase subunit HslV
MTTIAAVKKGKRLCIASDTLARFGSRKEIADKHVYGNGKIFRIGPNFIGMAGHPSWELILRHYFSKTKNTPPWETADQVFEIFNTLHQHLKERYFLTSSPSRYVPLECSDFEFLIINSHGIFEIDYERVVRHHLHFSAIGSGEDYALGAMRAVYDLMEDPKEIAKIGIEAAAQFDRKTDLPLCAHCIDLSVVK